MTRARAVPVVKHWIDGNAAFGIRGWKTDIRFGGAAPLRIGRLGMARDRCDHRDRGVCGDSRARRSKSPARKTWSVLVPHRVNDNLGVV